MLPYLPKIKDLEKHISVYNDLAILYRRRHMNDSTLYYYNKALEAALQYKDEGWITHIYNNVSVFYFNIRQLHEAEKYIDLATEHGIKTDDPFSTFSAWQLRAAIKAELDKLDDAEQSIRKAWEIACQSGGNASSWKIRCLPLPAEGIGTEGTAGLGGTLPANRQPPPGGRTGQLHRRHRVHTGKGFYGNEQTELHTGIEGHAVATKKEHRQ